MRVVVDTPDGDAGEWLQPLLDALVAINVKWLRAHPAAPSILSPAAGVRYERDPVGVELWRTLPQVLRYGGGDCEDLAAARAAELIVSGRPARAVPRLVGRGVGVGGADLWHVVTVAGSVTEDPSVALGMRGPA